MWMAASGSTSHPMSVPDALMTRDGARAPAAAATRGEVRDTRHICMYLLKCGAKSERMGRACMGAEEARVLVERFLELEKDDILGLNQVMKGWHLMGHPADEDMVVKLAERAQLWLKGGDGMSCGVTTYGLAKVVVLMEGRGALERAVGEGGWLAGALGTVARVTVEKREELAAQAISNVLWAWATVGYHPGEQVMDAMQKEVAKKVGAFNAQDLANTVWAWAKLGCDPGDSAMDGVRDAVAKKVGDFKPQELANTVWAWAKLGYDPDKEVMDVMRDAAVAKLGDFAPTRTGQRGVGVG